MDQGNGLVIVVAGAGLGGGLLLLVRGLAAYRAATRLAGIGTSRISTLAAGEVRLVGQVEPDVFVLVSPLQAVPCVYFQARIREGSGEEARTVLAEERAVGFRVRDASGTIRVFPRDARWDVPLRFDAASDWTGGDPPALRPNRGPALRPAAEDRSAQVAALLGARSPGEALGGAAGAGELPAPAPDGFDGAGHDVGGLGLGGLGLGPPGRRDYEERRLEPGDTVTIFGSALPFGDLGDPDAADRFDPSLAFDDAEVARNVAAARAAGILLATPEEAWGNAAIPGFGIGRPTRAPELDPAAAVPPLAPRAEAARAEARFEIAPGELIVAATREHALAVVAGTPGEAGARAERQVVIGLAGAALAIVSAVVLALALPAVLR